MLLRSLGIQFDHVYLSVLKRAIHTGHIVLSGIKSRLFTRNKELAIKTNATMEPYKDSTNKKHAKIWRRTSVALETFIRCDAPLLSEEEAAKQASDPRYKHLQVKDLPQGEH